MQDHGKLFSHEHNSQISQRDTDAQGSVVQLLSIEELFVNN